MPTSKRPAAAAKKSSSAATTPANAKAALPKPTPIDPNVSSGEAALARIRPQLVALPPMHLTPPRFNMRLGATAALGLVAEIERTGLSARLQKLHSIGEFNGAQLQQLKDLALAAWYIRHRLDQAAALRSEARLPSELAEQAHTLRARMLRVLEFHFEDDLAVSAELGYIRRGVGYQDLADDLVSLATLYGKHQSSMKGTPRHYQAADEQEARRLAECILHELGLSGTVTTSEWNDLQQRASLLLSAAYDEVSAAARYLCRDEPTADSRFPRLASIARSRSTPKEKPADPPVA